jgi:hypothetical protein
MEKSLNNQPPPIEVLPPVTPGHVPFPVKLLFWILLGITSVILAEVVSFSSPFPFFDGWGLTAVFPLYTLHVLVLAWIVFRPKKLTLNAFFLAGMLLGLYEAYITKVLWQPTWGDSTWVIGGVYVVQTAILLLFWHPVMAFMLPLFFSEGLFTTSRETWASLPRFLRQKHSSRALTIAVILFAVFCGSYQANNSPSAGIALLSCLAAGVVFFGFTFLWNRVTRHHHYRLRELLPSMREGIVLSSLLLILYIYLGITLRPEALPKTIGPHLTIWALYAFVGILLFINLRQAPTLESNPSNDLRPPVPSELELDPKLRFPWKYLLLFWVIFPVTSAVVSLVKPLAIVVILFSWGVGILGGLAIIVRSICAPGKS